MNERSRSFAWGRWAGEALAQPTCCVGEADVWVHNTNCDGTVDPALAQKIAFHTVEFEPVKAEYEAACFVTDTWVRLKSSCIEIQFIEPGMEVLSRCETTGEIAPRKVMNVFVHEGIRRWDVRCVDEDGRRDVIGTTAKHPFWVKGVGWVEASCLEPGQQLETFNGRSVTVTEVERSGSVTIVYNIEVEDFHTYFVDAFGILVHNKNTKIDVARLARSA